MTTYDSPSAVIPELEQLLLETSARRAAATPATRRAPRRRRRRAFGIMLAGLLTTGTALAATQPWRPVLGGDRQGHPTVASEPLPGELVARYGVLRRSREASDGDASVLAALRTIGEQNHGVHVDAVRRLGTSPSGAAVVLVPTDRFSDDAAGPPDASVANALCVFYPLPSRAGRPEGADYPCWTPEQLAAGRAVGRVAASPGAARLFGLVPDGVTTVQIELDGGTEVDAVVRENFFDVAFPDGASPFAAVSAVRWLGPDGEPAGPR